MEMEEIEIIHNLLVCDNGGIKSLWRQYLKENGNSHTTRDVT